MNFNQYLCALLIISASIYSAPTPAPLERLQRLEDLKAIAGYINQYEPIDELLMVTPAYTILPHAAVERFLAGIPEQSAEPQKRRQRTRSLLASVKKEWQEVVTEYRREKKMNESIIAHIRTIQKAIKAAFRHDILLALLPEYPALHTFISQARNRKSPIMVRSITDMGFEKIAAVFPVDPEHIQLGIADALIARFSPERIEEYLLQAGDNPAFPSCALILQHFIGNEIDPTVPLVSGVITTFEPTKMIADITTISATYGLPIGIKEGNNHDIYHVQHGMIFPHIYNKKLRYRTDTASASGMSIETNSSNLAQSPTLNPAEIYALEQLGNRIQKEFVQPVAIWFIKQDHTVYLLDLDMHPEITMQPRYLDPRYIRKCSKDAKAAIELITPFFDLIELTSRDQVILAPHVQGLLELYAEREHKDAVRVGIIRDYSSNWQSDIKRLRQLGLKVIRVHDIERVRDWMNTRKWPLIVDPQQNVILQYKRNKRSCALFYSTNVGTYLQEEPTPVSIIGNFIPRINDVQRTELVPDEFFGGVSLERLFDLLLKEDIKTATQALRTILFRLKYAIKRAKIAECTIDQVSKQTSSYHDACIENLKRVYSYVEAYAAHVLHELKTWHAGDKTPCNEAQLHFAINMLKGITLQVDTEQDLLYNESFKHLLALDQAHMYKQG